MNGQVTFEEYLKERDRPTWGGCKCICKNCLYWWSSRCPYGGCYDDHRAQINPYNKAHPDKSPRTGWSDWNKPGEQAHWCRGGFFYPVHYCEHFAKYKGQQVKECIKANVSVFQDGYISCSMIESYGCEKCYEELEEKMDREEEECEYMTPFGCTARDSAKELMLVELTEGSEDYKEISDICKKQCCKECEESCGYRCGRRK